MDEVNQSKIDPAAGATHSAASSSLSALVEDGPQGSSASQQVTKVTEIATEADFSQHLSNLHSETVVVIYFHAPWAAPCKQMSTVLETLASTYPVESPSKLTFLSINAEELSDISEQYDVIAVPYVVLQKGGQTVDTVSGSDASKVRTAVEKHAGKSGNPGKLGLPPAQTVSKPAQKLATHENEKDETESTGAKNLSAYAPQTGDPKTAPDYSSGQSTSNEELFKRLESLVKAAPVMLFMKGTPSAPQCGFSRKTVSLLRERSIRYGFFNILADDDVRQGLKEFSDWPTFPQLYVDGELVGGLDIVKEELENNPDYLKEYSVHKANA